MNVATEQQQKSGKTLWSCVVQATTVSGERMLKFPQRWWWWASFSKDSALELISPLQATMNSLVRCCRAWNSLHPRHPLTLQSLSHSNSQHFTPHKTRQRNNTHQSLTTTMMMMMKMWKIKYSKIYSIQYLLNPWRENVTHWPTIVLWQRKENNSILAIEAPLPFYRNVSLGVWTKILNTKRNKKEKHWV